MKKLLKSILIATASVGVVAGTTAAVVSCGESGTTISPEQKNYNDEIKKMSDYLVAHPVHFDINDNGLADLTKAINDYLTQAPTADKQYLTATVTSDMIKDAGNIDLTKSSTGDATININIAASDAYKTKVVTDGEKLTLKYTVTPTDSTKYASAIAKIHTYLDDANTPLFLVTKGEVISSTTFPTTLIGDVIKNKIVNFINSKQTTLTQDEKNSLFLGDKWSGITVSYTGTSNLDTTNGTADALDKNLVATTQTITIAIKGMPGSGAETTGTPTVYNAAKYIVTGNNNAAQYAAEVTAVTTEFSKEAADQEFPIVFAKGDTTGGKNAVVNAVNEYIKKHRLDADVDTTTRLLQNVSINDFNFSSFEFNPPQPGKSSVAASFTIKIKSTDASVTVEPKSFPIQYWADAADGEAQKLQTTLSTWSNAHPIIVSFSPYKSGQEEIVSAAIVKEITSLNTMGQYDNIFKRTATLSAGSITLKNYTSHYLGTETQNLFVTIDPNVLKDSTVRSFWNFSITISGIV